MTVTEIGTAIGNSDVGTPLNITVPAGGVAIGDLIVVALVINSETTTATVTDTGGNTYTQDLAVVQTGDAAQSYMFRTIATTALAASDTISIETSDFRQVAAVAAKSDQITSSSPLDKTASADTAFGTAKSSGSTATTTQADELLIGYCTHGVSNTYTADTGNGWTLIHDLIGTGGARSIALQYQIVSATGAYASTGTLSASDDGGAAIATYKAAASGTTYTKAGLAVVGP